MSQDFVAVQPQQKRIVGFFLGMGIMLAPFIFVWFLLRSGYSTLSRMIGFSWLVVFIIIIAASDGKNPDAPAQTATAAPAQPAKTPIAIPAAQSDLINTIDRASALYKQAPNELKKSAIRTQRANTIAQILKQNRSVSGWVGKITNLRTNNEGKAILEVELEGSNIKIKTYNNAFSDIGSETMIPQNDPLYNKIAEMSEGQKIRFGGTFLKGEQDFVLEASLSESGSMLDPEFIFKFKSVSSI